MVLLAYLLIVPGDGLTVHMDVSLIKESVF
jgi:hypothetical protein